MPKCMAYERDAYTLLATAECYIYEFRRVPVLDPVSLPLGDGSTLCPGDRITYLGGTRTCAGYRRVHIARGHLEYAGQHQDGDNTAVLFRWSECREPLIFYGAFLLPGEPTKLVFSTQHVAARIIETTKVIRLPSAPPPLAVGERIEAQRRTPTGIQWNPATVTDADPTGYRVLFADGAELPRPITSVRRPSAVN